VIATWAIFRSSFEWFCFGTFVLGANRGATQQYRFAAAEIADEAFRSKAISLVLAGGVVSAVFGAEVAKWSRDLFEPVLFAGCYALILVLFLASAALLYFVELPRPATPVLAGRCARSPWSRRSSRRRKPCTNEIMDVLEEAAADAAAANLYKSMHNWNRTLRMPQSNPIINPI
jgi:hypothetical protein